MAVGDSSGQVDDGIEPGKLDEDGAQLDDRYFESATDKGETYNPYSPDVTVEIAGNAGREYANVFIDGFRENVDADNVTPEAVATKTLIARISREKLETWPLNINPNTRAYLKPKYGDIKKITILPIGRREWTVPRDVNELDDAFLFLPSGFVRRAQFGLGVLREYRHILVAIDEIDSSEEVILSDDDVASWQGLVYNLGLERFDALRRGIDTITRRHQKDAREDKQLLTYGTLLSAVDSSRYPARVKKVRPGALYELVKLGSTEKRTTADRNAALEVVKIESEELAKVSPAELLSLKTTIELVTLDVLIEKFESMMSRRLVEEVWQNFFKANPFILSLVFAHPIFMVKSHAFVGGTAFSGRGEKIADFLVKNQFTGNLALIEIKRPDTSLVRTNDYRADLHGPDKHLVSAISQVLDQRYHLQINFAVKAYESGLQDIHPYAIHCIVIIGTTPAIPRERKSLELFRNASRDVSIVTFDEMLAKLKEIRCAMVPDVAGKTIESQAGSDEDIPF
jgi:hypothetical protein